MRRNGETCKGEFVKDEFTTGVYIDSKGSRYKNAEHPDKPALNGFFKKGRLFGYGRIDFFNGGVYEGLFKDGKRSGHGRMVFVMGGENDSRSGETAEYIGEWKYNLRHGNGKMTWQADGSRYEGLWHMDKRLQGTLKFASTTGGVIGYTGEFRDDLFHGRGALLLGDQNLGTTFEGQFEEGKCSSFGRLISKDGSIYLGEMRDFKKEGHGVYVKATGERYEGEFKNDQCTGIGQIFYPDGRYYIGMLNNYLKDGKGRLYFSSSFIPNTSVDNSKSAASLNSSVAAP